MFIYFIYIKAQEEDRTMNFNYGSRFQMGGLLPPPMMRAPMARGGMTNIFMMGGMPPSHCHCGNDAAGAAAIGGGVGLLTGLLVGWLNRNKQQTVVQYAPTGGYSGGGGYIQQPQTLSSTQQCTNLKTLYQKKGYDIVDNGDGTFSATDKNGNNVGRGSYDEMQDILGKKNDNAPGTTTDTTGTTDGKTTGSTTGTTKPKGTTTTPTTDGKGNVKPGEDDDEKDKKDGVNDSDKNKTTTDNTQKGKMVPADSKTDKKDGTVDDTDNNDETKAGTTNGGSSTKGTGSTGRTRGTGSASGTKGTKGTSGNKGTTSTNKTGTSQSTLRPTWNKNIYYDEKTKTHYELKNGKWIIRKDIKQANKNGSYYDKQGKLRDAQGNLINKPKKQATTTTHKQSTTSQMMRDRYKPENYGQ